MTTVKLKFDEKTETGKMVKQLLKAFKQLSEVKIIEEKTPNNETLQAMANVKKGKTIKTSNYTDFLSKINS
ncbi:MAG: hypothetical protein V4622_05850 [Bacteroidota bacterium]